MNWWDYILKRNIQVSGNTQKVKLGNIAIPTEDDTPLPESEEPPNCKEYVVKIDQVIQEFVLNMYGYSTKYKLSDLYDGKAYQPDMVGTNRRANTYFYMDEYDEADSEISTDAQYYIMSHPVIYTNFTWPAGDNISEKDACRLLMVLSDAADWEVSSDAGYNMNVFDTEWTQNYDGDNSGIKMSLTIGLRSIENYSQYNKHKLPLEREKEIRELLNDMAFRTDNFYRAIFRIAKEWKDAGGTLKKSADHPLGPITEYHGTMDIDKVMKQGLHGGKTNKRSNKHIPKQLRKVERITYTSDNKKEALKFAQGRAKQLGIEQTKVGVVGVRARDLEKPIEHIDSRWVDKGASVLVREGGIAVKYLERV